jgi:hypothetical protein
VESRGRLLQQLLMDINNRREVSEVNTELMKTAATREAEYAKHEDTVDALPLAERTIQHPSVAWLINDWREGQSATHDEIVVDLRDFYGISTSETSVRRRLKKFRMTASLPQN